MKQQKYLIVIGGPTASGKTGVAIKVAQHFNTEIISADSRQFYQEMQIGTAKPSPDELNMIKHHFVDFISVQENFTVGDFERAAIHKLEELYQQQQVVVLTGGSGLYIRALCEGLNDFPEVPPEVRTALISRLENEGIAALQLELEALDPEYFATVDRNNPQRLIRALEICQVSGTTYSSFRNADKSDRFFQPIYLFMNWEREQLYQRINQRVDQMIATGQVEEARSLYPLKHLNALQTVGYQELFDFFDEKIILEKAIELIKRNSRRYAKRQMTWLRKDSYWKGFSIGEVDQMIRYAEQIMHS